MDAVVPYFESYPLLSGKQRDFELFAAICRGMAEGAHRTVPGLVKIVGMAAEMNPSGRRGYAPVRILASLGVVKA